jgi:hypothetical protein
MTYSRSSRMTHGDVVWAAVMWSAMAGAVWMKLGPAHGLAVSALSVFFVALAHRAQARTAEHDSKEATTGGWAK